MTNVTWIEKLLVQAKTQRAMETIGFGKLKPPVSIKQGAKAEPEPKLVVKKPMSAKVKKPKAVPYGKAANGKIAGYLKLGIKWAAADRDQETRKVMVQIIKAVKPIVWDRLSEDKRQELLKL
jgi:hypothetical protein